MIGFVTRFDVDAPSVALTPGVDDPGVRHTDAGLVVRAGRPPGEFERLAAYEVTRIPTHSATAGRSQAGDSPGTGAGSTVGETVVDAEPLVVERVVRIEPLGTALWVAERTPDADAVRVIVPTTEYPPFDQDDARLVAVDGSVYRITVGELDGA